MPSLAEPVGTIAIAFPGATRVFHRHRIDYCCGGSRRLDDACRIAAADPQQVLHELDHEAQGPDTAPVPADLPIPALIDHILVRYHQPLKNELPRLDAMAAKVAAVHSAQHPQMHEVAELVHRLRCETELHLLKEEEILFPWLRARAGQGCIGAEAPIACLREEHDEHGANLNRLRTLNQDYHAPEGACGTWRALLLGLEELERELMEHISLENNLLFPRALGQ